MVKVPPAPLDPSSTWVFIVGADINNEWQEERHKEGDVLVREAFRKFVKVPRDRIDHVMDRDATKSNVKKRLRHMLGRMDATDTIVLYFWGHGNVSSFCTLEEEWSHADVVDTLEAYVFSAALILVDCCYAGNFCRELVSKGGKHKSSQQQHGGKSYGCIMSTRPEAVAGMPDTLAECLVCALRGDEEVDARGDGVITVDEVASFMADHHARVKGDILVTYFSGRFRPNTVFFGGRVASNNASLMRSRDRDWWNVFDQLKHCLFPWQSSLLSFGSNLHNSSESYTVQRTSDTPFQPAKFLRWDTWRHALPCAAGDKVFVKWRGNGLIMPIWYPATVISHEKETEDQIHVYLQDYATNLRWRATVGRHEMLPTMHFCGQIIDYDGDCVKFHCELAQNLRFLTCSLAPGTRVRTLWSDDEVYGATVACVSEMPWHDILADNDTEFKENGPYVPLHWDKEDTFSIVPLSRCVPVDDDDDDVSNHSDATQNITETVAFAQETAREAIATIRTPRQALMESLKSSGKTLHPIPSLFRNTRFNGFWVECNEWLSAEAIDLEEVTLEALAGHMCYDQPGEYYAVRWMDDGVITVLPKTFIRERCVDEKA